MRELHATYDPSDVPPDAPFLHEDAARVEHSRGRSGSGALWLVAAAGAAWFTARALARRARHFDLAGRVALVTGGSRGLGLELARQLVDAGARVAVCARDADELERARAELADRAADRGGAPGDVFAHVCDVTDPDAVERLTDAVRSALGEVDVLVNNAGVIQVGPSEQMTLADFDEAMRVNFYGALHTVLALTPGMRARGRGRVVNVSSIGGKVSVPHLLPYSASKFALAGLTEGLRASLAKDGVYVTGVYPGELRTGSARHAEFKGDAAAEYRWFAASSSAPVMSMDARQAARRILAACRGGDAELVTPFSAWLGERLHALAPGLVQDLATLAERGLPGPGPGGERKWAGSEVAGEEPGWARERQERAAGEFNEGPAAGGVGRTG